MHTPLDSIRPINSLVIILEPGAKCFLKMDTKKQKTRNSQLLWFLEFVGLFGRVGEKKSSSYIYTVVMHQKLTWRIEI
jgi:hypothetical protein